MLSFCLNFYQFQPVVAYKSVAYKKVCIWMTKSSGTQHHKHKNCTWLLTSSCNRPLTFYFESDSWIIFDCRNSFNKKLENLWTSKKTSLTQQIHCLHLKNRFRKNVIRLLLCCPFSPASICKYWTSMMTMTQACSQHSQISKMDYFAIMING